MRERLNTERPENATNLSMCRKEKRNCPEYVENSENRSNG